MKRLMEAAQTSPGYINSVRITAVLIRLSHAYAHSYADIQSAYFDASEEDRLIVLSEWKSAKSFTNFIESPERNELVTELEKVFTTPAEHQILRQHTTQPFTL